jgi:N-carbamoylputrescine amidase
MIINLGLVQMSCTRNPEENFEKAIARTRAAAAGGAQVICLPELFRSLYFCQEELHTNFALAESIPGPSTEILGRLAEELNVVIVASIFERRAPGVYHNTAVIFDADGALLGKYRKMHIPDDPLYHEKFYFTPGDTGYHTWNTKFGRIGVLICWDQWFPEAARMAALEGAQVLFYPTAIGWHPSEREEFGETQHSAWETVQRSHAITNGIFVAAVNRVGHEGPAAGGLDFWGASFVADPGGKVLARASHAGEETLLVSCDLQDIDTTRTHWPFLRDRRIETYKGLTERYLD